jgi:hypothetical protein
MHARKWSLLTLILVILSQAAVTAADLEFVATRKKLADQKKVKEGTSVDDEGNRDEFYAKQRQETVAYTLKVTNRSFRDMGPLTLKYMIFYSDTKAGSTRAPEDKAISGSVTTQPLGRSGGTSTVETTPVKLDSYELPPDVRWTTGAKNKSKDKVTGIWVRAYNETGEMVLDIPNPTTLKQKHAWKE